MMSTPPIILVIDDEADNFDVIETLLDGEDYQLYYANSGQQALERLDSYQPDVILLDVMMPDLDGIEVCKRIKAQAQWQNVPIIMVTALSTKEDLARCLAIGADDFISKPVNRTELRARINSMLRIKKQYDKLQNVFQLREDMVNMIVHDLRNPVTSIILAAEVMQLPNISPAKLQQKIEQIILSGQQLQSNINGLLLLAKLESGKMQLNYTEVDLRCICQSVLADIEAIASQKNLTLVGELPPIGSTINLDCTVFRRILDNLISNAIKFSPSNSQIILRVEYSPPSHAKIQVIDMGKGVSPSLKETIFKKYEIGTKFPEISQTGLGLAFCKMAIEAHQGTISVEDNHPRGSIFTISI